MDKAINTFNTDFPILKSSITNIENEVLETYDCYYKIITLITALIKKIDREILSDKFSSQQAEIHFFKHLKPQLVALDKYYRHIFQINYQLKYQHNQDNLINFLNTINNQINHSDKQLLKYYNFKCCHKDVEYFTLKASLTNILFINFNENINLNLTTFHSQAFANFIYQDSLKIHLNKLLSSNSNIKQLEKISWNDSKTSLVEIIYGIYLSNAIDKTKTDIKSITKAFETIFNIDLSDIYRIFNELKNRKINRTKFIDAIKENLVNRMDEFD